MIKPSFLEPEDQVTPIAHVFGAPVVAKGGTGIPLLELVAFGIFTLIARRNHPNWTQQRKLSIGALSAAILFGSEWCHNLAHVVVARAIGKPVDAVRVFFGTPLLIYYDVNNEKVSASQHMLRATGGPVFNALMAVISWLARQFTAEGSLACYCADFALKVNALLLTASLLPIPGLDGGSLLKWSFVKHGLSLQEADEGVKKVNILVGSGLATASTIAIKKRKVWHGVGLGLFAIISFAIGFGLLKERA
jgi:Zn-dependent protease